MGSEAKLFNEAMDEMLIEFVRVHPVLYQPRCPNYKDNALKENVWQEIALQLKRTVAECKTRWRTIRDSYKKAINKMVSKGNSHNGFWTFPKSKYNSGCLSFLDDTFKDRAISSSKLYLQRLAKLNGLDPLTLFEDSSSQDKTKRDESSTPDSSESQMRTDVEINDSNKERETRDGDRNDNYIIPDPLPHESSPLVHIRQLLVPKIELGVVETGDTTNRDKIKEDRVQEQSDLATEPDTKGSRKRTLHHAPKSLESYKKKKEDRYLSEPNSSVAKCTVNEHPIETFFRSMASTVMSFPPHMVAETRLEVCRIVTQMELRFLAEQSDCLGPRIMSLASVPPEEETPPL